MIGEVLSVRDEIFLDEAKLSQAIVDAQQQTFGFASHAFDAASLSTTIHSATTSPRIDVWKKIPDELRPHPFRQFHSAVLAVLKTYSADSNLGYVHVLQSPWIGELDWHRDIKEDDLAAIGYKKGRYRIAFNLEGCAQMYYRNPNGDKFSHPVLPGSLYVIDNSYNPYHMTELQRTGEISVDQRRLLMATDVHISSPN